MARITIVYATGSRYKREEVQAISSSMTIATPAGPRRVGDMFEFVFQPVRMREVLERDIAEMVRHKARSAYARLQIPCIVEHGGLVFADREAANYPGGLTQPMWDALDAEGFLRETSGGGRRVIARAVVGYCDGSDVKVFTGDTHGTLADAPRGQRSYYWDPLFQPDGASLTEPPLSRTYAEISDAVGGLEEKVRLSQSTKAMLSFLEHRLNVGDAPLFRGT